MSSTKLRFSIRFAATLLVAMAFLSIPPLANAQQGRRDLGDYAGFPGRFLRERVLKAVRPLSGEAARAKLRNVQVVAHVDPGGGFNGDVVAHH